MLFARTQLQSTARRVLQKDGISDLEKLHSHANNDEVFLYAFDLLELNGDDLRKTPLEGRKGKLEKLLVTPGGSVSSSIWKTRGESFSSMPAS